MGPIYNPINRRIPLVDDFIYLSLLVTDSLIIFKTMESIGIKSKKKEDIRLRKGKVNFFFKSLSTSMFWTHRLCGA